MDVRLEDGDRGEFSVQVGGRTVAQKTSEMPTAEQVMSAVRAAA